ncbi:MAG: hypothetical protein ACYTEL_18300 [Planctomycetota bacterium]
MKGEAFWVRLGSYWVLREVSFGFTEKIMVQKRAVLNKNRPVSATFGSVFARTGEFWNKTEQVVKEITPDIELEMRVVKESSDNMTRKSGSERQKSARFWKKTGVCREDNLCFWRKNKGERRRKLGLIGLRKKKMLVFELRMASFGFRIGFEIGFVSCHEDTKTQR